VHRIPRIDSFGGTNYFIGLQLESKDGTIFPWFLLPQALAAAFVFARS